MIVSTSSKTVAMPTSPTIDVSEIRWASEQLNQILQQTTPGSPTEVVLTQALRELASLRSSPAARVVGPLRVKAA